MPKTNSICLTPLLPPLSLHHSLSDCNAEQRRNEIRHVKKKHLCMPPLFRCHTHTHTNTGAFILRFPQIFIHWLWLLLLLQPRSPPEFVSSWNFDSGSGFTFLLRTHTLAHCFRISFLYTFFKNIYRKRQTKKKKNYRRELFVGCWPFCMTSCGMRLRWAKRLRRGSFGS